MLGYVYRNTETSEQKRVTKCFSTAVLNAHGPRIPGHICLAFAEPSMSKTAMMHIKM